MVLICEYRGVPHPVASPFHPHSVSAASGELRAPPPLLAPRFAPSDTIGGAEATAGASYCLLGGTEDGAGGFAVACHVSWSCVMCSCRCLPCLPRIARRRAALSYRRRSPSALCFRMMLSLALSCHARISISPRLSTRETGSRAGRVLTWRCGDDDVRRIKKSGRGFRSPSACFSFYRAYMPL